jgi:hypothetical protein
VSGFGSLWKPVTIGANLSRFLKNLTESSEGSDSHDKQIQKKSNGSVQVMTGDQSSVSITVHSRKKRNVENLPTETENHREKKKEILHKETIVASPSDGYYYEFDLTRGEHVKGEVTSTNPIDVFFTDESGYEKWSKGRKYFDVESSNDSVLQANIDYVATKKGKWYVIVENNQRKSATVKVELY